MELESGVGRRTYGNQVCVLECERERGRLYRELVRVCVR